MELKRKLGIEPPGEERGVGGGGWGVGGQPSGKSDSTGHARWAWAGNTRTDLRVGMERLDLSQRSGWNLVSEALEEVEVLI